MPEEDLGNTVRVDDMVAHRISDGSWSVYLGEQLVASLGRIFSGGDGWVARRYFPILDADGNYYGDEREPETLGTAASLEDAVLFFGPAVAGD